MVTTSLDKWRREVRSRAGMKCERCGSDIKLEAHHILRIANFPDLKNETDNGVLLCHKCHVWAHGGSFLGELYISPLSEEGYRWKGPEAVRLFLRGLALDRRLGDYQERE